MAKQEIVTLPRDSGDGTPIANAFDMVNDNTDELYEGANITATAPLAKATVADTSVTLSLSDDSISEVKLDCTNSPTDNYLLSYDLASEGFTWVAGTEGDLTAIVAGDGLTGSSLSGPIPTLALDSSAAGTGLGFSSGVINLTTHTGDVTGTTALSIATDAVVTAKILDANVTHAKLENRYTSINAVGTTSGAFNIDFSLGTIQTVTLGGAHTGTFINFKVGQVVNIVITGNYTLTFDATSSGTAAMRKVGAVDYDGSATQIIQVVCASADSTTPIFYYNCATYATDVTP